jgi:hypothetical protein
MKTAVKRAHLSCRAPVPVQRAVPRGKLPQKFDTTRRPACHIARAFLLERCLFEVTKSQWEVPFYASCADAGVVVRGPRRAPDEQWVAH